jgi:5'-nucleotidase
MRPGVRQRLRVPALVAAVLLCSACAAPPAGPAAGPVTIAVIGTNDVHGQLLPGEGRGGLVTLSGYVDALRDSGEVDAVLLLDAGDMWQGTLESNLNEGASVVAAYNALGYAAAAIGNHEFDFGPAGPAGVPSSAGDDPRGALRQRAREADFPLLAANLRDAEGRQPPVWDNVQASATVKIAGIEVGIVGVMTEKAMSATIASNVEGLAVTPLAAAVRREAEALRRAGADLVIVTAHAGGRCSELADPDDLSSCEPGGEIFALAEALPPGLVDHIVAGHIHHPLAHVANGISITSNESRAPTFGRVDFVVAADGTRERSRLYPPTPLCPYVVSSNGLCAFADPRDGSVQPAPYAGTRIEPDPAVAAIARQAHAAAEQLKDQSLGVILAEPFTLKGNPESALANLVTHALLESFDADVAIHNVHGGLRAVLPAGELTFGSVYEMFPFDNRVVVIELTGEELADVIAAQVMKGRTRAGVAGIRITAECTADGLGLAIRLDTGELLGDEDRLRVIVNDFLALGGDDILLPVLPEGGFPIDESLPGLRDALVHWFRHQERLHPEDFSPGKMPHWQLAPGC